MFWAITIMGYKGVMTGRERRLLDEDLILLGEDMRILPDDVAVIEEAPTTTMGCYFERAGVLKNRSRIVTVVPGGAPHGTTGPTVSPEASTS